MRQEDVDSDFPFGKLLSTDPAPTGLTPSCIRVLVERDNIFPSVVESNATTGLALARLSLLEGFSTREGALNGHRNQKVCTTGTMFYFCSKSFRRELMRGGGWAGSVSLSCSSKIF